MPEERSRLALITFRPPNALFRSRPVTAAYPDEHDVILCVKNTWCQGSTVSGIATVGVFEIQPPKGRLL